jgi:hypothetical protein
MQYVSAIENPADVVDRKVNINGLKGVYMLILSVM